MITVVTSARGSEVPRSELDLHYRHAGRGFQLWTTMLVAGRAVDALVDTGSTGLVLLSSAIDQPQLLPKGPSMWTSYGDGERFGGHSSRVPIQFSKDASLTVPVLLATSVSCLPSLRHCPAERVDFAHYRIGGKGDRIGGEGGFGAILGIGMPTPWTAPNPFAAAGIERWIVDWPNSKIILNPDDRDLDGFVFHNLIVDRWAATIPGCLAIGPKRICGPTLLDTGATDIVLFTNGTSNYEKMLAAKSHFLTLGDRGDAQAIQFTAPADLFQLESAPRAAMVAGAPVVKDLAIFYDSLSEVIGVKPAKPMKPDIEPELQVNAAGFNQPAAQIKGPGAPAGRLAVRASDFSDGAPLGIDRAQVAANAIPQLGTLSAPFARPAAAEQ
jgi:hypothetical protein